MALGPKRDVPRVDKKKRRVERLRRAGDAFHGDRATVGILDLFPAGRFEVLTNSTYQVLQNPLQVVFLYDANTNTNHTVGLPLSNTYEGSEFIVKNSPQNNTLGIIVHNDGVGGNTIDDVNFHYQYQGPASSRYIAMNNQWETLREFYYPPQAATNCLAVVTSNTYTITWPTMIVVTNTKPNDCVITLPDRNIYDGQPIYVFKRDGTGTNTIVQDPLGNTEIARVNSSQGGFVVWSYRKAPWSILLRNSAT